MNWDKVDSHTALLYTNSIASKKKRFFGFVIDRVFGYLFAVTLLIIVYFPFPNVIDDLEKNTLLDKLITLLLLLVYYIFFEYFFQKSIGKMILGMKVINEYSNTKPSFKQIVGRKLSRIIGWEAFFYLSSNELWHDKWSETMVIDEKLFREQLELHEIKNIGQITEDEVSLKVN